MSKNIMMINNSGCNDPTAGVAMLRVSNDEKAVNRDASWAIRLAKEVIEFAGFRVVGRIKIVHMKSGREFR